MRSKLWVFAAFITLPVHGEDFDAPFAALGELPQAAVDSFEYELSLQAFPGRGSITPGRINGVMNNPMRLRLTAESVERVPGDGAMSLVVVKKTVGDGLIDFAAIKQITLSGQPDYPPDKPAAMFRSEIHRLLLVNDEVRLRLRFKHATHNYLIRYEAGKGLRLVPLAVTDSVLVVADLIPEFTVLTQTEAESTWRCNPLTTWATQGDKLLWSTDAPLEGQPKSMKIVGDVLFIVTTAGHSVYIRKDTGEVAFYDKSVLPGNDPMQEILELGRANMAFNDKRRSLAPFIYAAVVLDDRRSIPFLIDCIGQGDGIPVRAMAIAALERFNGNPDLWEPKTNKPGTTRHQWVPTDRIFPRERSDAEIAKWREVFAAELQN
jgi:hypothetical protein